MWQRTHTHTHTHTTLQTPAVSLSAWEFSLKPGNSQGGVELISLLPLSRGNLQPVGTTCWWENSPASNPSNGQLWGWTQQSSSESPARLSPIVLHINWFSKAPFFWICLLPHFTLPNPTILLPRSAPKKTICTQVFVSGCDLRGTWTETLNYFKQSWRIHTQDSSGIGPEWIAANNHWPSPPMKFVHVTVLRVAFQSIIPSFTAMHA